MSSKVRDTEIDLSVNHAHAKEPSLKFVSALNPSLSEMDRERAIEWIRANWSDQLLPYYIEIDRFSRQSKLADPLWDLLAEKTPLEVDVDFDALNSYVWSLQIENTDDYAFFKQLFHRNIDLKFERYFEPGRDFNIRLDEVAWGGVSQDGIPPLRSPKMLKADEADYLENSNVVFGIEINGDARAYPQRILAWHEMFVDTVGGVPVAGVYCTLCGTVIIYHTIHENVNYALGTSGFLYRSNKLMYDQATQSLWSTIEGKPVIGPLVGKGIELGQSSVVTTTWGEWKERHPDTQVLSLDTGHRRNYGEGVAYNSYFSTDKRMFETPYEDDRLDNKAEILALRFLPEAREKVAISVDFLLKNPVYIGSYDQSQYVVLTDSSGANRVYEAKGVSFVKWDQKSQVKDSEGRLWTLSESALTNESGVKFKRLDAHRAFWFGWHGAYPDTVLIQ